MNIECLREVIHALSISELIGTNALFSPDDVCEVLDTVKNIVKGQNVEKTKISSNTPQKIMKLYAANFSPIEIADMLNLTVEEVSLVTTTSDNEITTIAQRMYDANIPNDKMAELLGVPVEAIESMFGILESDSDEDSEDDDEADNFADNVFDKYIDEESYRGDNN